MKGLKFGGAISRRAPMICGPLVALLALGGGTLAQAQTVNPIIGAIDAMTVADPTDTFSAGTITVAGQLMIVPRNLLIDAPAARFTLAQGFGFAPGDCLDLGESGLAAADTCLDKVVSTATVLANRQLDGTVIVGDLFIDKGNAESITGIVTAINHTEGYLRINGDVGDIDTGTMLRFNDPTRRHSIQDGDGCRPVADPDTTLPSPPGNCSADTRFGLDPDNYTITFTTGYPACLPSTVPRTGTAAVFPATDPVSFESGGGNADGTGDALCPASNRNGTVVADSTHFAPVQVLDHLNAGGNFEDIGGVRFFSAHTVQISTALTTQDDPSQPDYVIFAESEWDMAGFQNERVRALLIGFTTLGNADVEVFKLAFDPATGGFDETIVATTIGCDIVGGPGTCTQQGTPPNASGIFKIRYDTDFIVAALDGGGGEPTGPKLSICYNLNAAGYTQAETGCSPSGSITLEDEFQLLSPIPREAIVRSLHKGTLTPGVITVDASGNEATNGEYLTPVGQGHPEFVEVDLAAVATAFSFEGQPWNLDRRIGPGGFNGETLAGDPIGSFPLDPFPCSGLDPRYQVVTPSNVDVLLSYTPFGATDFLPLESIASAQGCALFAAVAPTAGTTPPPEPTGGGTAPAPDPSDVQVGRVQLEADKGEWRIDGTTDVNFEALTVYVGDPTDGIVVGRTSADDIGVFSLRVKDSDVGATSSFVTVVSDNTGGSGAGAITFK